jgi:DNA repair exonuclease SbcCD nuclease subunit
VFFGKSNPRSSDFDNIYLHKNKTNILILHGAWEDGAAKSAEIPLGFLKDKGIDYCALGHYHTYQAKRIDARGIAVYAGCPEGRGFDETGEKGAVLIEADGAGITHRFLPIGGRTFHRIEADVSEAKSLLGVFSICENAVSSAKEGDLLRLVLIGKRAHCPAPDTEAIERHFGGRFYYLEVEDASSPALNLDIAASEASLRGEFVRTVLAESGLDEEERMRILSLGLAALGADASGGALWS